MLEASSCSFSSEKLRRMLSDSSIRSIDTSLNSRMDTPPVNAARALWRGRDIARYASRSARATCGLTRRWKGIAVGWTRRREEASADSRSGSEPARCAEAVVLLVFADDQVIGQREVEH